MRGEGSGRRSEGERPRRRAQCGARDGEHEPRVERVPDPKVRAGEHERRLRSTTWPATAGQELAAACRERDAGDGDEEPRRAQH